MAKLVSRFIWIWPTWDSERTSKARPHESETVQLGWFWVDKNIKAIDFCRCERVVLDRAGTALRRCVYNNETNDEETTMSPDRCHIKTDYISEYVSAHHVVDKMTSSPGWMVNGDAGGGIIVDIDEDFFGCESPSDQLAARLGTGSSGWRHVELIDRALSAFLCPRTAEDESIADRFARRLVRLVVDVCRRRQVIERCRPPELDAVIRSAFVGRPSMFCGTSASQVKAAWISLAELLARVPVEHLRSVLHIGFCLNTAPRTHNFRREQNVGDFIVCYGANEPNSTIVYRHTPSADELDAQMRSFDRLVTELLRQAEATTAGVGGQQRRPLLVTVCRSIRDGYTPRSLAASIEEGILSALRRQRRSGTMTVVYDKDLLGGRGGWSSRP